MLPVLLAAALLAQATTVTCPSDKPLPDSLAHWSSMSSVPAVGRRFNVAGSATLAELTDAEKARPGTAAIIPIEIKQAGTYGIVLSDAAWIDVTHGDKTLPSIGHDHGPPCSGIRKIVKFDLAAGSYQIRLSGIAVATIGVMVTPD